MADGEEKQIPIVAAKEILIEIETNMKIFHCPIVWVCIYTYMERKTHHDYHGMEILEI